MNEINCSSGLKRLDFVEQKQYVGRKNGKKIKTYGLDLLVSHFEYCVFFSSVKTAANSQGVLSALYLNKGWGDWQ